MSRAIEIARVAYEVVQAYRREAELKAEPPWEAAADHVRNSYVNVVEWDLANQGSIPKPDAMEAALFAAVVKAMAPMR